uniref:Uncharacterized protein n=1 Tax=Anguilla anguilla TaxID=7936 RepID=A0A0E9PE37_ANGAN
MDFARISRPCIDLCAFFSLVRNFVLSGSFRFVFAVDLSKQAGI